MSADRGFLPHENNDAHQIGKSQEVSKATPQELTKLANDALKDGRIDEARQRFTDITVLYPRKPAGLIGLARCAQVLLDWNQAAHHWSSLIEQFPNVNRPAWHQQLAASLSRAGHIDQARQAAEAKLTSTADGRKYWEVTCNAKSGTPEPLRFDHVLVITYGRSGSTILQGVLNTIDGLLLRGENGNIFQHFFEMTRQMEELRMKYPASFTANQPWFGLSNVTSERVMDALRVAARQMLLADQAENPSVTCLGFKEIRYIEITDDLPAYLAFLEDLFPNAALVFNTRELEATVKSGWWAAEDPQHVMNQIRKLERLFDAYADGRTNCYAIKYEDVVAKNDVLRKLFNFLGASFDIDRIDAALAVPHSFRPTQPKVRDLRGPK